ncbi:DUF4297 domain-containing protein [Nocardia sp. CA2R105]|uniref:DUF4297 domain-containing protein n=1 Tax=Nocardia coffeae TaxID=2873381 RepID=UPI001CA79576|nr:DUF4297 domain-containing protein [Nocardia coffeae]MBY8863543.1 DUF4297 domain-containing protein [Nocardia coffeae]
MPPEDPALRPDGRQAGKLGRAGATPEVLRPWEIPTRADDLDGLAAVVQLDDAGATTADLYEWQAAMAAADGLSLYRDALDEQGLLDPTCDDYILCEWHEDWVVCSGDAMELVSGKHRSADVGAYTTVNKLANDGGLAHLFNRWFALEQKPLCRLVTTGGLTVGPARDLKALTVRMRELEPGRRATALTSDEAKVVTQLCAATMGHDDGTAERWTPTATYPGVAEEDRHDQIPRNYYGAESLGRAVAVRQGHPGNRGGVVLVEAAQERVELDEPGLADLFHPAIKICASVLAHDRCEFTDEAGQVAHLTTGIDEFGQVSAPSGWQVFGSAHDPRGQSSRRQADPIASNPGPGSATCAAGSGCRCSRGS